MLCFFVSYYSGPLKWCKGARSFDFEFELPHQSRAVRHSDLILESP